MMNPATFGMLAQETIPPASANGPTAFQVLGVGVFGTLLALTIGAVVAGRATRKEGLLWGFVWSLGAAAVAWPEVTMRAARALGIGRGADLLLYGSVVVMLTGFMMVYLRIRRLQRDLTLVVRHLALREAAAHPERGPEAGLPS